MIGFQELMLEQGLKTKEIENKIGVKQGAVAGWYSSKVPKRHLKFLAEMFNIEEDYLNKKVNDINTSKPRAKGFNNYEIVGEDTKIFVTRNDGIEVEFIVDTNELQKLIELNQPWNATYDEFIDNYYGVSTLYHYDELGKRKQRSIRLHEVIMGEKYIDHINHDSKDNRKINLRKVEQNDNLKNRKSKNSNNKSGYRNVIQIKDTGKYIITLCINNKRFRVGKLYTDVHEAGRDAEKYRQEYYGEFAGKS